MNILFIL